MQRRWGLTLRGSHGLCPVEHQSSPCSAAGIPSRMVSTQQAQHGRLLPHGLQPHHALSPSQGTVPGSLPFLPDVGLGAHQGPGAPREQGCFWLGGMKTSPRRGILFGPPPGVPGGKVGEERSGKRTGRKAMLGNHNIFGGSGTRSGWVTEVRGQLFYLMVCRSLPLRCHWSPKLARTASFALCQIRALITTVTIYYPHHFVFRKLFQISKSREGIISEFREVSG